MTLGVALCAEASRTIGGGHVQRCLALAEALIAAGHRLSLVTGPATLETVPEIARHPGLTVIRISDPDDAAEALREDTAVVVLDRYGDTAGIEERLGRRARLAVIEDHPGRPHRCDLLIDSTYGRLPEDYAGLVTPGARLATGSPYALLREPYRTLREAAIRRAEGPAPRIFVSFGATDPSGLSLPVVRRLATALPEAEITLALGAAAPGAAAARAFAESEPRVRLHLGPASVAAMMAEADLGIGAAGVMSWERCCLALPSVAVPVVANQDQVAAALQAAGAAHIVAAGPAKEVADRVAEAAAALVRDAAARAGMAASAAALCDGRGALRVRGLVASLGEEASARAGQVALRPARPEDSALIWAWRNDPVARAASRDTAAVPWATHSAWYARALADPDRLILIAEAAGDGSGSEPVGVVRFDRTADGARTSIAIAPASRGAGLGRALLRSGLAALARHWHGVRVVAEVRVDNEASLRLFRGLGFAETGSSGRFLQFELAGGGWDA